MLFQYTVLGDDSSQQKGEIEADSKKEAIEKLNNMGLTILSIEEFNKDTKTKKNPNLKVFQFAGKDSENKEVDGSIEADNEVFAYKRLVEEFAIDVLWIVNAKDSKIIQEANKKTSVKKIEDLAYERGIAIHKKLDVLQKDDTEIEFDEAFYKKQKSLVKKINKTNEIIAKFLEFIRNKKPVFALDLKRIMADLDKIKMSNNLIYIQDSLDKAINKIIQFFDKYPEERKKNKMDLLEIESYLSNALVSKFYKNFNSALYFVSDNVNKVAKFFYSKTHKSKNLLEHEKVLLKLTLEKRVILKLLLYHLWGMFFRGKDLKVKHKKSFFNLLKQYKKTRKIIKKIKESIKNIHEFEKKDFTKFIDEIHYFSLWLLMIYILFFSLIEISVIKSKILSVDFSWKILQSGFIVSFMFLLFLIILVSPWIKKYICNNITYILASYFFVFLVSYIFYFNY